MPNITLAENTQPTRANQTNYIQNNQGLQTTLCREKKKDRLENWCKGWANCSLTVEWKKLLYDEFVLKRVGVNMEKVAVNESTEIL